MQLLNAYQLAYKLGVSHTTIYSWIEKGLPYEHVTIGKRISMRFDFSAVKDWLKENQGKVVKEYGKTQ